MASMTILDKSRRLSSTCTSNLDKRCLIPAQFKAHRSLPSLNRLHHRTQHLVLAAATPGRDLSLNQRWRSLKFNTQEKLQQLAASPPISTIVAAIAAFRARLQPLFDLIEALKKKKEALDDDYNQFLAEETKRQWTWSKIYAKELDIWSKVPRYLYLLAVTLMYETLIPVSFVLAVLVPLYYAWVMYDKWWLSPFFLGMLIMTPLKYAPWGMQYWCWLWPGII